MKREIIRTQDGSKTIHFPEINESYHSTHGALQEAMHVFIKSGWDVMKCEEIRILEIGLGTGLNAILSYIESVKSNKKVVYTGLEAYPVSEEEVKELNYSSLPEIKDHAEIYLRIHQAEWEKDIEIAPHFILHKKQIRLEDFLPEKEKVNLIYFDAFGPRVQPEMWTESILVKMYEAMEVGGVFVTYSSKGDTRRGLLKAGFDVEKIPGPPGKREMLRAYKRS